ncbi:MAG: sensor histidine kinase N-terminal domain-containing protein [Thiobacillus sp.]|nr:sensor histidine kinase N-terminal domain-containing protein [Thiobacillus sp.]
MKSLRARLLWSAGAATLVVWGIAVVASYQGARHEAIEFLDGQLAQSARLLLSQVRHEMEDLHEGDGEGLWEDGLVEHMDPGPLHGYEQPLEFQVWALDGQGGGRLVLRSPHAPLLGLHARPGYAEITHDGREWRILNQRDGDQRLQVQVAQPTGKRSQAALEVALRVLAPFTLALPLLVLLLFMAVGRGLRPLERLAADVAARAPDALAPLPTGDMPQEVLPLVTALNTLLERLGRALDNERRFTADAAHELRTPLAALQVQAQVAHMARDETTRNHAVDQVLAGVTRATHLVEQLLRLARLDPMDSLADAAPCPLAPLAEQVAESLRPQARARDIVLDILVPGGLVLRADADLLGLALRNLLENAMRHGSEAGRVEVGADEGAEGTPGGARLWVRDDGPGVPQGELARLTERFYRGREVSAEGNGLGLAITQRIAKLHGAELRLENLAGGGFQATLAFPAALSVR